MRTRLFSCLLLSLCLSGPAAAEQFLVTTSESPGFAGPEEVAEVLEKGILPTFDMLMELKTKRRSWLAACRPAHALSIILSRRAPMTRLTACCVTYLHGACFHGKWCHYKVWRAGRKWSGKFSSL